MTGVGVFLLRHRRWLAGLLAALAGLVNRLTPLDLVQFSDLGRTVLAGRFDEAYAGTFTQAGPLQLVLSTVVLIGGHDGMPPALPRVLVDVALTLGAMAACGGKPIREGLVAVVTLLWLLGPVPWSGHPPEVLIPVLWAAAVASEERGRWWASGAALGVSALITPLAVLGYPCLLAATGPVRAARTMVAATGIAVLGYLPFVLSGRFGMFGHVWPVVPGTVPYQLGLHEMTWWARLGQAVVVAGGCALVAYLLRGRPVAMAAAPLTAALLRVATDPQQVDYYWLPVSVGTVLLIALLPEDFPAWRQVSTAVMGYLTMLAATTDHYMPGALLCSAGFLLAGVRLRSRSLSRPTAPVRSL
ncbi:hypothetical protein ACTOB_001308 [Actinoplanes oblitus]|uniref:DUF2029 domain-containing protein n=1 Tax=Actinoplanes oblitus TaxID=3040509 RepID=A0ABY8WK29_9ACTN|nr:hypothetical protein [Actinoplanes oblitus]WIM97757.1 hypothetical protein ACTOB_001308 [Actinoplanes oblitus]